MNIEIRMEHFLNFFVSHLPVIIQWLIAIILLLMGFLFAFMVFGSKKSIGFGNGDFTLGDLGAFEKKLSDILIQNKQNKMDQTQLTQSTQTTQAIAPVPSSGMSSPQGSIDEELMSKMKQEIAQKESEIALLKQAATAAPAQQDPSAEINSYLEKIKVLEGKLAEYEIIEDDIADLSLFKEENATLKKRIEELEGQNSPTPQSKSAEPTEQTESTELIAEPVAQGTDILPDLPPTEDLTPVESSTVNPSVAEEAEPSAPTTTTASAPSSSSPSSSSLSASEEDDILAEFTRSLGDINGGNSMEAETPSEKKENVNTDKMLEEMESFATLTQNETATPESLENPVDTEKMTLEADKLVSNQ